MVDTDFSDNIDRFAMNHQVPPILDRAGMCLLNQAFLVFIDIHRGLSVLLAVVLELEIEIVFRGDSIEFLCELFGIAAEYAELLTFTALKAHGLKIGEDVVDTRIHQRAF